MEYDLNRVDVLMARIQHIRMTEGFGRMKKYNIHPKQIPVLLTVKNHEGISQRELAEQLHVKPPTIAVSVKRLGAAGLILKEEDEKDARISRLYLTDMAREVLESTQNTINEAGERMLEGFTDEEKRQFTAYLERILDNLGPGEELKFASDCDDDCK